MSSFIGNKGVAAVVLLLLSSNVSADACEVFDQAVLADNVDVSTWLSEAEKIVQAHGSNGRLSSEQFKGYQNQLKFREVDSNKDGKLQFEEYRNGYLYCTAGGCNSRPQSWYDNFEELLDAEADADAGVLYDKNADWSGYINYVSGRLWGLACPSCGGSLNANGVARYLAVVANGKLRPRTAKSRNERYLALRSELDHDESKALKRLVELEIFEDADNDATCSLDVREVKAKLDHPKLLTQFGIISQGDFHIELAEFRTLMEGDLPGDEDFNLRQVVNAMRSARLDQFPEEEDTRVADVFENQENDQRAEQEQKAKTDAAKLVSGTGWVPHRGLVLYGNRKYDEHGKRVEVDWSQPSLLMRVVQDFAVANSRATPAKLNWTKSAGDDAVFGADAAIRFDYYNPAISKRTSPVHWRPAIGLELERSGAGAGAKRLQKYYLWADLFAHHDMGVWQSSQLQFGPVFERETVKNIDKLAGEIEWVPYLLFPRFTTGIYQPVLGSSNLHFYLSPRLALEFNELLDAPDDPALVDDSFFRYGARMGLAWGKHLTLDYEANQRRPIDDFGESFFYNEAQLNWSLDEEKRYTLSLSYKNGEDFPDFESVEEYTAGIGIKF